MDSKPDIIAQGLLKQLTWLFPCSQHLSFIDDITLISAGNGDRKVEAVYDLTFGDG